MNGYAIQLYYALTLRSQLQDVEQAMELVFNIVPIYLCVLQYKLIHTALGVIIISHKLTRINNHLYACIKTSQCICNYLLNDALITLGTYRNQHYQTGDRVHAHKGCICSSKFGARMSQSEFTVYYMATIAGGRQQISQFWYKLFSNKFIVMHLIQVIILCT